MASRRPRSLLPPIRVQRRLCAWFARHQRTLPWRASRDPYAIWISEIMLQQTQVATVVPYFERFLQTFPTIELLAAADEQQVLHLWQGLGYYRRARQLHQAARLIVAEHGGRFPVDPAVVRTLPGFGRYTVGAVLSQAFDQRLPILEANSRRVLARLLAYEGDPRSGAGQELLWRTAEELLPQQDVGTFNQALMELGALVCTPTAPQCGRCPLAKLCAAHERGLEESVPRRAVKPAPVAVAEVAVVVQRQGTVLLVQRPTSGRWPGMWEFPHTALQPGEAHEQAAQRMLFAEGGLEVRLADELLTVRHSVTHHRITLRCLLAEHERGELTAHFYTAARWVQPAELEGFAVSSPQRKLAKAVQALREGQLF